MLISAVVIAATLDTFSGLSFREIGPAISGGRTPAVAGVDIATLRSTMRAAPAAASSRAPTAERRGIRYSIASGRTDRSDRDRSARRTRRLGRNGRIKSTQRRGVGGRRLSYYETADARGSTPVWNVRRTSRALRSIRAIRRIVAVGVLGRVSADDANRGVYVTRDGGLHWMRALYAGPSSGVSSLVRVPGHPSTLFAGVWQVRRLPWRLDSGGPNGGIYRSDDNGATWHKLKRNGLPSGPYRPDRARRRCPRARLCHHSVA